MTHVEGLSCRLYRKGPRVLRVAQQSREQDLFFNIIATDNIISVSDFKPFDNAKFLVTRIFFSGSSVDVGVAPAGAGVRLHPQRG